MARFSRMVLASKKARLESRERSSRRGLEDRVQAPEGASEDVHHRE
jgi:hypothetical protein